MANRQKQMMHDWTAAVSNRVSNAHWYFTNSSSASSHSILYPTTTRPDEDVSTWQTYRPQRRLSDKIASRAVLNHLRFLRSKGRSVVGVDEVAKTLDLPASQVERVASKLHSKGVKLES